MSAPTIEEPITKVDFSDHAPRRRRLLRALGIVLALVLAGLVIWLVWFSSVLSVKAVRVIGVSGAQATSVLTSAAIPLGEPVARIDADGAQAAVLRIPWVASAEIRRGWPNEIVIAVSSRTPIAIDAVSRRGVDATGVVFDTAEPLPPTTAKVTATGVGLVTAMSVLASLPPDLAGKVETLSASSRDDVDLGLRSGAKVHWGSADQAEYKARVLRALLKHKKDVYDVTAPELPTTFNAR